MGLGRYIFLTLDIQCGKILTGEYLRVMERGIMEGAYYKHVIILGIMSCAFCVAHCTGDILYIDTDAPGAQDGTSWQNAYNYLQDALSVATAGDTIKVAQGIYTPDVNNAIPAGSGNRNATFQLVNGVSLQGGYAGYGAADPNARDIAVYESILSGDLNGNDGPGFTNNGENSYHVVTGNYTDSSAVMDGFIITAGNADGSSTSNRGGGMYNNSGCAAVTKCLFRKNLADTFGGGMYNRSSSNVTLNNCDFVDNKSSYIGGGMYNYQSSPRLVSCVFRDCTSTNSGGGIFNAGSSNPEIINCIFNSNSTDSSGGGMYNYSGTHPKLINCTFISNIAEVRAGITGGSPKLTNCIFWGNHDRDGTEQSSQISGGNINYCCVQGWTGSLGGVGNIGDNPLFIDANGPDGMPGTVDDNIRLSAGSPCKDAGDNLAIPPTIVTDADGNPRIMDLIVDMGAYEANGITGPFIAVSPQVLEFSADFEGANPDDQTLNIWSGTADEINWEIAYACDWMTVEPNSGSSTGDVNVVTVSLDISELPWGYYECEVNITDPCALNSPYPVIVTLDLNSPSIECFPNSFDFSAYESGTNPASQILSIRNGAGNVLNWFITEDCSWLNANPTSGSSTGEVNEVTLTVDISGLTAGIYDCNLTITDPCATNSPYIIPVSLTVIGPLIGVSSLEFTFDANEGGTNPANQMLFIDNIGGGTLEWEIAFDCNWLTVEPNSGSSTGEMDLVTLTVDVNGLEDGIYDCNLIISDPDAQNSPVIVAVRLELTEVWRDYIVFPDDPLTSNVIFESEPRWVKFTIKLDDPCTVYFQNSKLYPFHYQFATEWLEPFIGISVSEYYDVAIYDSNQLASLGAVIFPPMEGEPPVPEFAEYGIQFVRYDPYTKEEIAAMFTAVKNRVIADPCVIAYYFPSYEQLQVAEENQAWFESQGIPIGSAAQWMEGNICYSEGWAIGDLKYFPGDQIQNAYMNGELLPEDILLTDGVPAEVPFVAGIITLAPSTQNSHVAILSKTYGIPFVYLTVESDISEVWQLVNDLTLLCVFQTGGSCNVQLKDAIATFTPEEVDELFALKSVTPLEISPMEAYGSYGADTNNLLPVDINHFGGKASNYGILRTSIPDNCPNAVALSFDLWNDFLDQPLVPSDSVIIAPNGYVLFWADDDLDQGAIHTSFKLGKSGEDIGLFDVNGSMIDGFSFASQTTDVSYGRTPDGNDSWSFFSGGDISPNVPNPGGTGITGAGLFINEFMADNDSIIADEYGEYDDWIEIYNSEPTPIDLGGMYLTDDLSEPTKFMISVGITGSTLREEIDNRLAGYTYPPSNLAALSADLAAVRNIITNASITSFSPQLMGAVIAVLQDPNYGFDPNSNIRFRSSTNMEDSETFTGAGLYDSYSGCLADDLDGDDSGPCICDPNKSNERGVFRAIRKVFASFYNENAYLERLRRDVNEAQVGMALLVHHSFPDEFELANGVATMEKKLSPPHWNIMLSTQKGATPVTNPEEGALPEEVSVYAEPGGGMAMTLIRQSNLVILGETVMDWQADYNDLTALLVVAAQEFEQVTGKTEYILDFEYKKVAPGGAATPAGGVVVKQIREIPPLDTINSTCPSFDYNCPEPPYSNNYFVEQSYEDASVSIETSYYLYCPADYCFNYDFYSFCRTVIRGYTTRPIVMFTGVAEPTYWGMSHYSWLDYYFTPSQEPGMDQCLLNQLRAKDIRVIHLHLFSVPNYVETTGFGSGPYYLGDFDWNGDVDFLDFAELAWRWMENDCGLCGGVDLDCDGSVGLKDLEGFIDNWLVTD